jgi:transcriptional regulator with XRE-family HTH domain
VRGQEKLAAFVRAKRADSGWTQDKLAKRADTSLDSVRRIETAKYALPTRPRSDGHALDRVLLALGHDVGAVVSECFSKAELAPTIYARLRSSHQCQGRLKMHPPAPVENAPPLWVRRLRVERGA